MKRKDDSDQKSLFCVLKDRAREEGGARARLGHSLS